MSDLIPEYRYYAAPEHLRTRRQLAAEGLCPSGEPAAFLVFPGEIRRAALYSRHTAVPAPQPTNAEIVGLPAWEQHRRLCPVCKLDAGYVLEPGRMCSRCVERRWQERLAADKLSAAVWARTLLADPRVVILALRHRDGNDGRLVDLALLSPAGDVLLNTLIDPQQPISHWGEESHGITDAMVEGAPWFAELAMDIHTLLFDRKVVCQYPHEVRGSIHSELRRMFLSVLTEIEPSEAERRVRHAVYGWLRLIQWIGMSDEYASFVNEWSRRLRGYCPAPLAIPRRALDEARECLRRLQEMAAWADAQPQELIVETEVKVDFI